MVSQLWPDSKAEQKRAPKTPRYVKRRRVKGSKSMSKKDFKRRLQLSPAEQRILALLEESAIGGVYSGSQAKIAKSLEMHPQTVKVAFGRLSKKEYLVREFINVYRMNPARHYTGPEEMYVKAVNEYEDLVFRSKHKNAKELRNVG